MDDPKVGDIWYRIVDQAYSIADEYGDHHHTSYQARVERYKVVGLTKQGVWIQRISFGTLQEGRILQLRCWNKQHACPTIEEAKKSYAARKDRQIAIYKARARAAEKHRDYGLALKDKAFQGPL